MPNSPTGFAVEIKNNCIYIYIFIFFLQIVSYFILISGKILQISKLSKTNSFQEYIFE